MDPIAVRDQIDRILHSQSFASKSQLRRLLEILFKSFDAQSVLKPDFVIRELWPAETRTKRAADVATEMNRLRNALESYYEGEGKNDPVTICLPKRSAPSANGPHAKRWIAAVPRGDTQAPAPAEPSPIPQQNHARILKILVPIALLGLFSYISIPILAKHDQPQSGRLDGTALRIMNAEGKEICSKSFRDGFWSEYYDQGIAPRIWFGDLDGKCHTDVLLLYHPARTPRSRSAAKRNGGRPQEESCRNSRGRRPRIDLLRLSF